MDTVFGEALIMNSSSLKKHFHYKQIRSAFLDHPHEGIFLAIPEIRYLDKRNSLQVTTQ